MASLRKRRGNWYGRIRWSSNGKRYEKNIPFYTQSKSTAVERLMEIRKVESYIREGMEFSFPWLSNALQTQLKRFTIEEASKHWNHKRKGIITPNTLSLNQQGLSYLETVCGKTFPLNAVESHHMEKFVGYLEKIGLSNTSINIHLKTVKEMFNYFKNMDKVEKIPFIKPLSIPRSEPIYITDDEFQAIMDLTCLDHFYKEVFLFYRETGIRLRELEILTLNGNWIDIPNTCKGKQGRSLELSNHLVGILIRIQAWLKSEYGSTLKNCGDHLSKRFKSCLIKVGVNKKKHLHCLRHTFAVK